MSVKYLDILMNKGGTLCLPRFYMLAQAFIEEVFPHFLMKLISPGFLFLVSMIFGISKTSDHASLEHLGGQSPDPTKEVAF